MVCLRSFQTSASSLVWHPYPSNEDAAATAVLCWGPSTRHCGAWTHGILRTLMMYPKERKRLPIQEWERIINNLRPRRSWMDGNEGTGESALDSTRNSLLPRSGQSIQVSSQAPQVGSFLYLLLLSLKSWSGNWAWVKNLWVKGLKNMEKWLLRTDRRANQETARPVPGAEAPPGGIQEAMVAQIWPWEHFLWHRSRPGCKHGREVHRTEIMTQG